MCITTDPCDHCLMSSTTLPASPTTIDQTQGAGLQELGRSRPQLTLDTGTLGQSEGQGHTVTQGQWGTQCIATLKSRAEPRDWWLCWLGDCAGEESQAEVIDWDLLAPALTPALAPACSNNIYLFSLSAPNIHSIHFKLPPGPQTQNSITPLLGMGKHWLRASWRLRVSWKWVAKIVFNDIIGGHNQVTVSLWSLIK